MILGDLVAWLTHLPLWVWLPVFALVFAIGWRTPPRWPKPDRLDPRIIAQLQRRPPQAGSR